jgi:hypothetical protein
MHPAVKTRPRPTMGRGLAATAGRCALCKGKYAIPTTRPYRPMPMLGLKDVGNPYFSPLGWGNRVLQGR